jgi:hypothetical protein
MTLLRIIFFCCIVWDTGPFSVLFPSTLDLLVYLEDERNKFLLSQTTWRHIQEANHPEITEQRCSRSGTPRSGSEFAHIPKTAHVTCKASAGHNILGLILWQDAWTPEVCSPSGTSIARHVSAATERLVRQRVATKWTHVAAATNKDGDLLFDLFRSYKGRTRSWVLYSNTGWPTDRRSLYETQTQTESVVIDLEQSSELQ